VSPENQASGATAKTAEAAGQREAAILETAGIREAGALRTAGQRRINLIWEVTQAAVAILVTLTTMVVVVAMIFQEGAATEKADKGLQVLSAAFFLIIGFYFSRTNHTKTGGISGEGER
jgi:hypothetical protein